MGLKKKVQTVYLILATAIELLIGLASAFYLEMTSLPFFLVMATTLIAIGSIEYFVLQHDPEAME